MSSNLQRMVELDFVEDCSARLKPRVRHREDRGSLSTFDLGNASSRQQETFNHCAAKVPPRNSFQIQCFRTASVQTHDPMGGAFGGAASSFSLELPASNLEQPAW